MEKQASQPRSDSFILKDKSFAKNSSFATKQETEQQEEGSKEIVEEGFFEFSKMKEGDWFGHSEMLEKTVRRNRMVAETKVLALAIRIHELMECIDEELHELLKCHVFDHQDL